MDISEEIKEIKSMLERMEAVIDSRLIGIEEPEADEIAEIEEYERRKREGKIELCEISRVPREKGGEATRRSRSRDRKRISEKIVKLEEGFAPSLDIKKLKGYKNH